MGRRDGDGHQYLRVGVGGSRPSIFTPEVKAQIVELYGVEPQVRFAEVSALIDNTVGVA